jgi:Sec-independent protein translocase protein TatA|tara:strand:+ start:620 stop:1075 length:456 start_codon:yes stop_codon:yes gene_type:complete
MFDIIASVLTGGATGIIGSLIGTVGRFFEKKQQLKEMTLQFDQEYKLQELQISSRREEAESERAIAELQAESEIKTASYAHDASYGITTLTIAAILRFVRPVLTFLLLAFTVYIFWEVSENPSIVHELSNQIMFLTTTAVAWWFGDRSLRK